MSNLIAIVGDSGSGKSTSISFLDPKETVIINVAKKPLPFRGWKGNYKKGKLSDGANYFEISSGQSVCDIIQAISDDRPEVKCIVIDDATYLMSFEFMNRLNEKGYDKYNDIAEAGYRPVEVAKNLRDDLDVIFTYHQEVGKDGKYKIKTCGQLVDNHILMEGLFTTVLYSRVKSGEQGNKYYFLTNTDGNCSAKSPMEMFEINIPNNLQTVRETMQEYYHGEPVMSV